MKRECLECNNLFDNLTKHITEHHNVLDYCTTHFHYKCKNFQDDKFLYESNLKEIKWNSSSKEFHFSKPYEKEEWICEHCNAKLNMKVNSTYVAVHLKSSKCGFGELTDYVKTFFTELDKDTFNENEICGCCDKLANNIEYEYDFKNKTFKRSHINYFCNTEECKIKTFNKIWPEKPYSKLLWSKIGGSTIFLSMVHKIPFKEAQSMKVSDCIYDPNYSWEGKTVSLPDYKIRYGDEIGKIKYDERCDKISKNNANNEQFFINKFGVEEGKIKWELHKDNRKRSTLGTTKSKSSDRFLDRIETVYELEREYKIDFKPRNLSVDAKLKDKDVIIEFFGDYWHCNPSIWHPEQFNKNLKLSASEKWIIDDLRLDKILQLNYSIIVIWEQTSKSISLDKIIEAVEHAKLNKGILIKL
jgi:hypothetical protein